MATVDMSKAPYYDSFDPSDNYTKVAAVADRPLQQREINELQSQLNYRIKGIGDGIYREGAVISGLDFSLGSVTNGTIAVSLQQGMIYIAGKILATAATTVTIPSTGDGYVYATYVEEVVTSAEDSSLNDPVSTSVQGADRIRSSISLTAAAVDNTSAIVYHFQDGSLFIDVDTPVSDDIMKTLAQRTQETNGSYRVNGLGLSVDKTQTTDSNVSIIVGDGLAYVRGYRISKVSSSRVSVTPSKTTRQVINETRSYDASTGTITLYEAPVANVTSVTAPVSVTETVSRGSGLSDILKNTNVVAIKSITSQKGTVYGTLDNPATTANPADVTLQNGNQISWRSGSNTIPTTGSTYQVTYYYVKTMVVGTDYSLKASSTTNNSSTVPTTDIVFSGMGGDKPVSDVRIASAVSITYNFYLARRDLITLDALGYFHSIQGNPDTISNVTIPTTANDDLSLHIGWVTVYPNSQYAETNDNTVTNLTFGALQKMQARIQTIEYNVATMAQDIVAAQGHDPLSLRGVFSDGFNSYERADINIFGSVTYNADGSVASDTRWKEAGSVVPMAAWSFDDAYITLPYQSSTLLDNSVNTLSTGTAPFTNPMQWTGRVITAPYRITTEVSQLLATGDMSINPYMVYQVQTGTLALNPAADVWQDTNTVVVNNKIVKNLNVNRYWRHNGNYKTSDSEFVYNNLNNISWDNVNPNWIQTGFGDSGSGVTDKGRGNSGTINGSMVTNGGENTSVTAIPYMRPIEVTFTAKGLRRNADNLYVMFNNIRLSAIPLSPSVVGTQAGTIRADNTGVAMGKFTIPTGQPTGTVDVFVKNDAGDGSSANTTFTSAGTTKTVEQIINTTFYQVKLTDPLAESFQFDGDRLVPGVNLYFSAKDTTATAPDVIVQIRSMSDGGTPTQQVLGQSILKASDIKVSADSNTATSFYFDNPVQLDSGSSYALVVISNSPAYRVFYAKMGDRRLDNNSVLTTNPYDGVMFSSANAQSWTIHQDADLKFDIMVATFVDGAKSTVLFDPVNLEDKDGNLPDITVSTLLSALAPTSTVVTWEYRFILASDSNSTSIDDGTHPWYVVGQTGEFDPNALVRIIQLRATLQASKYISPRLSTDILNINALVTGTKGTYVGKNVSMGNTAGYNTVTVSYKQYAPAATTVTPKFLLWHDNEAVPADWQTLDTLKTNHSASVTSTVSSQDVAGYVTVNHVITLPQSYTGAVGFNTFKIRIDLSTTTQFIRPNVKELKVVLTDE